MKLSWCLLLKNGEASSTCKWRATLTMIGRCPDGRRKGREERERTRSRSWGGGGGGGGGRYRIAGEREHTMAREGKRQQGTHLGMEEASGSLRTSRSGGAGGGSGAWGPAAAIGRWRRLRCAALCVAAAPLLQGMCAPGGGERWCLARALDTARRCSRAPLLLGTSHAHVAGLQYCASCASAGAAARQAERRSGDGGM